MLPPNTALISPLSPQNRINSKSMKTDYFYYYLKTDYFYYYFNYYFYYFYNHFYHYFYQNNIKKTITRKKTAGPTI